MSADQTWVGGLPAAETAAAADAVERAQAGDRAAYGELVEGVWNGLVALARSVLASDVHAEDLVQDTLVHAWQRLGMLRDRSRFEAWLRRSLVRRCLRQLRTEKRRAAGGENDLAAAAPDPAARLDVAAVLAALSPRQRVVVYLTIVEGRTDREIAAVLGLFPPTVRVHRMRAMRRLRLLLGES